MNLLIVGSRSIKEFDFEKYIPDGVELIISGGASGIDTLAEKYADNGLAFPSGGRCRFKTRFKMTDEVSYLKL